MHRPDDGRPRARPLTPNERAVIERLLSVDFPDVDAFRAQIEAITARTGCAPECDCGSLLLQVDRTKAKRAPSPAWDDGPQVLVEGDRTSWLMLFQDGGWLTELEHVPPYGPPPDEIDASSIEPDLQVEDDWFE